MAKPIFGKIASVIEGDAFPNRKALSQASIHRPNVAGIDGNPREGCSSIVLNGGYVDDEDHGNYILYTGHGGNEPDTKRQIADQKWDSPGNKALIVSEMKGLHIRVTRGNKHKSPWSPGKGYKYGGLYQVVSHFQAEGKDGF